MRAAQERATAELPGRQVVGRVELAQRRRLVEQVVPTEAQPDVVGQLIAALEAEQVVVRVRRRVRRRSGSFTAVLETRVVLPLQRQAPGIPAVAEGAQEPPL